LRVLFFASARQLAGRAEAFVSASTAIDEEEFWARYAGQDVDLASDALSGPGGRTSNFRTIRAAPRGSGGCLSSPHVDTADTYRGRCAIQSKASLDADNIGVPTGLCAGPPLGENDVLAHWTVLPAFVMVRAPGLPTAGPPKLIAWRGQSQFQRPSYQLNIARVASGA
jgi:hypothetical protein